MKNDLELQSILGEGQYKKLEEFSKAYLHLLKTDYLGLNLTRILEEDDFFTKQIIDSLKPVMMCEKFKKYMEDRKLVVDVGFGGGFPILPLAFCYPDIQFVGIEARRKKVDAVKDIAGKLKISNVILHHQMLETIDFDQPCLLTFKAVGAITSYVHLIHSSSGNLNAYFYKGPSLEITEAQYKNPGSGFMLDDFLEVDIYGVERRTFVGYKVPHGTQNKKNFKIDKQLVKLSQLL